MGTKGRKCHFRIDAQAERFNKQALMHLLEGQYWGNEKNRSVRVFAVGLGTGAWATHDALSTEGTAEGMMHDAIIKAYINKTRQLKSAGRLDTVEVIEFSYHGANGFLKRFER